MTKICEYENVQCCFCGSKNVRESEKTIVNQHEVICEECRGTFFIPCED